MRRNDIIEKIKHAGVEGFNQWREYYDKLSFNQHKDIANYWSDSSLLERSAHPSFFMWAFKQLIKTGMDLDEARVAELGPADGWLAYNCMSRLKLKSWIGYDISTVMVERTLPEARSLGFVNIELNEQFWDSTVEDFDIFVSSHTIEHLSDNHFKELLKFISPRANALILEIYIKGSRTGWRNYGGSHILTLNGNDIDTMIRDKGFVLMGGRYMGWLRHPLTGLHTFKHTGFKHIGTWRNHFTGVYIKTEEMLT